MSKGLFIGLTAATLLLLAGCAERQMNQSIDNTQTQITAVKDRGNTIAPPVLTNKGFYVDTNPISLVKPPNWLFQRVSLNAQDMPFQFLLSRLLRNTGTVVDYQPGVQQQMPITMQYQGQIKGALDKLAGLTGYDYTAVGRSLSWTAFETKIFNISFMPGASNYLLGQQSGGDSGASSSTSSGSSASFGAGNGDQQFTNLQGKLSVWQDIAKTLDDLKSDKGKVVVSESTASVTAYDHPANISAMTKYIDKLNQTMSQQVGLKVQVLEIDLNNSYAYGINWNQIATIAGTKLTLAGNLATGAAVVGSDAAAISGPTGGIFGLQVGNSGSGGTGGSNAILNALSTQGRLRVVTEPSVVTMNNQVAEIRINTDTSYLASASSTAAATNVGATSTLTPGTITTGLTLYLLPKIQDNDIYLQVSSTLSSLVTITPFSASTGSSTAPTTSSSTQPSISFIELPTLSEKSFNIRSIVESGATLIVAGFKEIRDNTKTTSFAGVDALGGKGGLSENTETILLITPQLIHTNSSYGNQR